MNLCELQRVQMFQNKNSVKKRIKIYLKPKQVSSLPCIHVTEPTVFPKRYASAQQLTIRTETLAVTRLSAFTEQCDRLNPVICDWESFPPYCKRLLEDNMEKSSSFLGKYISDSN